MAESGLLGVTLSLFALKSSSKPELPTGYAACSESKPGTNPHVSMHGVRPSGTNSTDPHETFRLMVMSDE